MFIDSAMRTNTYESNGLDTLRLMILKFDDSTIRIFSHEVNMGYFNNILTHCTERK